MTGKVILRRRSWQAAKLQLKAAGEYANQRMSIALGHALNSADEVDLAACQRS